MIRRATLALATLALLAFPAAAQAEFGLVPGSTAVRAEEQDGTLDFRAGSHPYAFAVRFKLNTGTDGRTEGGEMRDTRLDLPPGLFGNPNQQALPRCSRQDFEGGLPHCSPSTQVGVLRAIVPGIGEAYGPIYNLAPPPGVAAQLAASAGGLNTLMSASLRSEEGYGVHISVSNVTLEVSEVRATLWGVPADPSHDGERYETASENTGAASDAPLLPFLTLPTSCAAPLRTTVEVDSKLAPGAFVGETAESLDAGGHPAALGGCDSVPFKPAISAQPSSRSASSSSGLDFELGLPNEGLLVPHGTAETEPQKIELALPEGMSANPAAAEGLATCTEAQYEAEQAETAPGQGCPQAAKVGTIEAHSPLLEEALTGSLYLATPYANETHSFIGLYLVARAKERGILVKQAVKVQPDPATGQLTSTIEGLPPLPYSDVRLHLREGPRALLVTPPSCGTYTATAKLYPFSAPETPVQRTATFQVESGAEGGPCPSGSVPFNPALQAGTTSNSAGQHSPFYLRLTRRDGDQPLTKLSSTLPPGLLASLVGVGRCTDAQIAQASSRSGPSGGAEELADPSCPANSLIGHILNGAGVGGATYVPGNLYLAGPYNGAPLSVVAIVPGLAGPFDVGTIVVRLALRFNPTTAQAEVDGAASDPIPAILQGIPLALRDVRAYVDRPNWTFNPTNCEPLATQASAWGLAPVSLQARFQAADCAGLGFKPSLGIALKGGTRRGRFPALTGTYTPRAGDANLRGLVVRLPHSEFIEQAHFRTVCTRVQYAAGEGLGSQCPAGSVYGWARAYTPLLEEALEGPVFLRSSSHKLPDLVGALHGIVDVEAVARIDSYRGGLRATFTNLPDAPVSKVVVRMRGGRKGLIVNSTNLCAAKHRAAATYAAQSGRRAAGKPVVRAVNCKKHKRKRHAKHKRPRNQQGGSR